MISFFFITIKQIPSNLAWIQFPIDNEKWNMLFMTQYIHDCIEINTFRLCHFYIIYKCRCQAEFVRYDRYTGGTGCCGVHFRHGAFPCKLNLPTILYLRLLPMLIEFSLIWKRIVNILLYIIRICIIIFRFVN